MDPITTPSNSTTTDPYRDGARAFGSPPESMRSLTDGAHETIDRVAERVAPHVEHLQENLSGAAKMVEERSEQIREVSGQWLARLRCSVRDKPLAAVAVALAAGILVTRLSR